MKKLLLITVVSLFAWSTTLNAQACTFSGLGVKINSITTGTVPGTCVINFDFYFDVEHNSGGKYFWVHIWPTAQYPAFNYVKPPTTSAVPGGNSALNNSIATFGYYHFQSHLDPQLSYPPDPSVPNFQTGYTLTEIQGTPDRYTAHGLTLTLPQGCNVAQSLTADAWESQSDQSQTVQCFSANQPFYLNDPTIANGLLFCQIPRKYRFDITTLSIAARTVNYKVFIDNGDGVYNSGQDTIQINSGTESISSTTPFHSGTLDYLPYSNTKPYSDRALWVVILKNGVDLPNDIYQRIENSCIPLPVTWSAFTATRKDASVNLRWVTSNELNNKGFMIEKRIGNADWQEVIFINSQAPAGTSTDALTYQFTDANMSSAVTQYRLRQVDIDNKYTYSEVRLVAGYLQGTVLQVFPNPASDGKMTLLFKEGEKLSDIKLLGMDGRIVKQWNSFIGTKLDLGPLSSGMYMLSVFIRETQEKINIKVIVNN